MVVKSLLISAFIWVLYGADGLNPLKKTSLGQFSSFWLQTTHDLTFGGCWGLLWRVSVSAEQTGQTRNICAVQVDYSLHITHGEVQVMEVTGQHFYSLIG